MLDIRAKTMEIDMQKKVGAVELQARGTKLAGCLLHIFSIEKQTEKQRSLVQMELKEFRQSVGKDEEKKCLPKALLDKVLLVLKGTS